MRSLVTVIAAWCLVTMTHGQGIPFIRNFTAEEYHANNINFDIDTDKHGHVYVANFEGLLYYDQAEWRLLHSPGITRITVVYRAEDNNIWVGGYNYFGKVVRKANGDVTLRRIADPNLFHDEVEEIYENDGELLFVTNNAIFQVKNEKVTVKKVLGEESLKIGVLDVVNVEALERGEKEVIKSDTVQVEPLDNGLKAVVLKNAGISITDDKNHLLYTITDANGLCTNNIAYIAYDGHGHLWGATGKGIFVVQIPAAVSRFTTHEGLVGTVLSIGSLNNKIYAGTDDGLYRQEGRRFVKITDVPHACWDLKNNGNELLAATSDGIFRVYPNGNVRRLTIASSMALLNDGSYIYSGENDGVYLFKADGQDRKRVCQMNNVRKIVKDNAGTIWAQSLYGNVWYKKTNDDKFYIYKTGEKAEAMQTIVMTGGKANIISAESKKPFPYPLVSYNSDDGVTWLTDYEGKRLYRWKDGKRLNDLDQLLYIFNNLTVASIFTRQNEIWLGSDNGLTVIDTKVKDPLLDIKPRLNIRSIKLGVDSIIWGGFGTMPETLPKLSHNDNDLHFTFSLDYPYFAGQTMYRYRLNDGKWSAWSHNTSASFVNLNFGNYTFYVQSRDMFNHITDATSIKFSIKPPFYYSWYMNLVYLLLLLGLMYGLFQLRLHRLNIEKIRLEKIVQERSSEIVRLEKMATAGKLTQGLIDRILNPLNYIINFAKLSEGLVGDAKANIEDEKEHMDEENYDDTMDVLDMITGNLQKVGEHGQNTSRTLKAMEEMLKDRTGGIVDMDLMAVIRQDEEMLHEFYKKEIEEYGIKTVFGDTNSLMPISGNADQLSKTIMSLLGNAVYAVIKKAQKLRAGEEESNGTYTPEIMLMVDRLDDTVQISIHDNGIGIESAILDKIFDPFFTTKTTSEAAGVGLYLSREIVQNHGGDIQVKSTKDEYSEFIITLPVKKA